MGHYRWTRKKVCFLTLVNQVNGPLGGRSRVPNGLIREEEVDDKNEQQGEGHRLTHLQPSTTAPCPVKDTQISWGVEWSHISSELIFCSGFARTTVKCGIDVSIVQCAKHDIIGKFLTQLFKEYLHCKKTLKMYKNMHGN